MWQDDTIQTNTESEPVKNQTPADPIESHSGEAEVAPSAEGRGSPQAAASESAPLSASKSEDEPLTMDEAIEQSFRSFEKGEIIRATVVQVDREGALVDVGTKTEVRIPLQELSAEQVSSAEEVVKVGDEIEVKVLRSGGEAGTPVLSKREADFERLWEELREAFHSKRTIEAPVVERVKGGVVLDIGVRCFVPASQIAKRIPPHQLDRLIGETLPVKIIDLDEEKRKAVASHKLADDEIRRQREQEERDRRARIFNSLQVGQRLTGVVRRLTGYGAFVDIGDYEGLLHVSEIAWTRIDDPAQVLKEGDEIEVVVIRLEPENGKVALSRRQLLPDPWHLAGQHYREGDVIEAPVSRVVRTGAFVKLEEGIEGFIPLSELSSKKVRNPEEVVKPGETLRAKVIEITPRRRWMVLSVRALDEQRAVQEHQRQRAQSTRPSGFTIGERLSAQFQELQQFTQPEQASDSEKSSEESTGESGTSDETKVSN